jgi:hypothetical protein
MESQLLFTVNTNYTFRHAQGRGNRLLISSTPPPRLSVRMSVRMYQLSSNGHILPPVLPKDTQNRNTAHSYKARICTLLRTN